MAKKFRYQHIMSAVEGKLPTAEQLKDAEIAVNVFAGAEKLAVKNSNDEIVTFATEAQVNNAITNAVEGLAVKSAVDDEINAAVAPLQEGIDALDAKKANVEDVPSIEGLAKAEDVTAEIAAAVEPLAVKSEVTEEINAAAVNLQQGIDDLEAKKVDWTESTPGRKHIVLANHDSVLGTALDGTTYNVAMVSKWDVADFGSAQLHLNLNSKDGVATINDDKQIATVDDVNAVDAKVDALEIPSIEGLAVASEVTAEIAAAVEPLATKAEVEEAANAAVAKVVADAPEAFDTLKEVADYIASDQTKAAEIETKLAGYDETIPTLATKAEVEAVDAKVDAINLDPYATKEEVAALDEKKVDWTESTPGRKHIVLANHDSVLGTALDGTTYNVAMVSKWDVADFGSAQLHLNLNSKDGVATINDDKQIATVDEVAAVDAKVDALVIPSIEGLAKADDVTAEIAAAVEPLATKDEVEAVDAKVDALEIPSIEGLAVATAVTAEIAAAVEPLATKAEVEEAAANAVAQVVANAPEDLDTLKEVADYIASDKTKAAEIETTLSGKADKTEVEAVDAKVDALVIPSIDGLAVATAVTAEIAAAVAPLANTADMEAALANKANVGDAYTKAEADEKFALKTDVYTKAESDENFQPSGDYVPVEDYNALLQKVNSLENYVNIFIKDREEKMDEIISNMDADNKEVVIETPMESIVVPETTVAYTITAPLADNSTVELTSPKYMTLINTSEEPVSTTIGHTFESGETTGATSVYLVGDFDTLTLENVSPSVKSGYDAASVNNVVITENNVKNLTLALDIQDGATITNNSNASITIQDKNDLATTITIVAPNSTVTLNGSTYEEVNATVSDNTLVIRKNVAHIGKLNVAKGNVIVEVAREALIDEKIGEYTLADGYTIDYLHDEITSANISKLTSEGTHVLAEDIEKSGNFSVGVLSSDDIIWDLNGHNMTCSNTRGYGIFRLRGSAHLEVNDTVGTGVVKNTDDDYGLWAGTVGCKIVINGGHFEASTHVLYAEKGTIEVNGGSFRLTNEDTADKDQFGNFKFLVNCHDEDYLSGDAKIIIRGGKFYGWNPSASYGEPGGPVSFVAEGFHVVSSVEDGINVYEVVAD